MAAVPDTIGAGTVNNWSLTTVQAAVSGTPTSLTACFTAAEAAKFDSSYSGSKNQLLNFRNYNPPATPHLMSQSYASPSLACASTEKFNTVYFLNDVIEDSVSVFTDQALTTTFTGGGSFYKLYRTEPTVENSIQISNLGSLMDPPAICT